MPARRCLMAHMVQGICMHKNVATVDAKGRIKAKAAGKCTVYVIAVNGTTQAVQIIVK